MNPVENFIRLNYYLKCLLLLFIYGADILIQYSV